MWKKMPNIAQVEFLYPLRVVVRFHDEGGELTALALEAKKLSERRTRILNVFESSRGLRRWILNRQSHRNAGKYLSLRKKALRQAQKDLRTVVRSVSSLAVEHRDRSFRPVENSEARSLLESASKAKSAYLFVFEPNGLLADNNEIVATVQ